MHQKTNFISVNEGFKCLNCGHLTPPSKGTCRNHCTECLHSLHVDKNIPGDREEKCHGLMKPLYIIQDSKKGVIIFHKCMKCGTMKRNKTSDDDNQEKLTELSQNPIPCQEIDIKQQKRKH